MQSGFYRVLKDRFCFILNLSFVYSFSFLLSFTLSKMLDNTIKSTIDLFTGLVLLFACFTEASIIIKDNKFMTRFSISRKNIFISSFVITLFLFLMIILPNLVYYIFTNEFSIQKIFSLFNNYISYFSSLVMFGYLGLIYSIYGTSIIKEILIILIFILFITIFLYLVPFIFENLIIINADIYINIYLIMITLFLIFCNWKLFKSQEFTY